MRLPKQTKSIERAAQFGGGREDSGIKAAQFGFASHGRYCFCWGADQFDRCRLYFGPCDSCRNLNPCFWSITSSLAQPIG